MKLMWNPPSLYFLPLAVLLAFSAVLQPALAQPTSNSNSVTAIDGSGPTLSLESGLLKMGGQSSGGHEIRVNNRYLTIDGKPWLPVMGEFHFSRYPEKYWEEEILRMKAGGIQIISTYVFWIRHEEVEGQFDWTERRDLRVSVLNLAASLLATCPEVSIRNGPEAEALASRAQQLTAGRDAAILDTLSAAHAEAGRFPEAVEAEQRAIALATQQGKLPLANTLRAHLAR